MMKQLIYILLFAASCSLLACAAGNKTIQAPKNEMVKDKLDGEWELNYISDGQTMDTLYPDRKPTISFNPATGKINGNSSCNSYFGQFKVDGRQISFPEPMGMTKMFCGGRGEQVYMNTLKSVNIYSISDEGRTLHLIRGDIAVMRFTRK